LEGARSLAGALGGLVLRTIHAETRHHPLIRNTYTVYHIFGRFGKGSRRIFISFAGFWPSASIFAESIKPSPLWFDVGEELGWRWWWLSTVFGDDAASDPLLEEPTVRFAESSP
jgi:hypothetical protein